MEEACAVQSLCHSGQSSGATVSEEESCEASEEPPIAGSAKSSHLQSNEQDDRQVWRNPRWKRVWTAVTIYLCHARDLICAERINVLLVFVPIGITVGYLDLDPIVDFILNALGIIPLAVIISTATECLASRMGDRLGALFNVTVGNAAELMIFYMALSKDQMQVLKASLLGSVQANLLLVLGTAFVCGGLRFRDQICDRRAGRLSIGLLDAGLLISLVPIVIFTCSQEAKQVQLSLDILNISRGISIGLIVVYVLYLVLQMHFRTAGERLDDREAGHEYTPLTPDSFPNGIGRVGRSSLRTKTSLARHNMSGKSRFRIWPMSARSSIQQWLASFSRISGRQRSRGDLQADPHSQPMLGSNFELSCPLSLDDEDQSDAQMDRKSSTRLELDRTDPSYGEILGHRPSIDNDRRTYRGDGHFHETGHSLVSIPSARRLHVRSRSLLALRNDKPPTPPVVAFTVLLISAVIVSMSTELAVDAIPAIVDSWHISHVFLGFIVLPIVGNAAEHVTAAKLALHNKMVLAKSVAVESSTQIVLLVVPAVVLLAWAKAKEMSLVFDAFEMGSTVVTASVVSAMMFCGRSGWKSGCLLISFYLVVAAGSNLIREGS